MTSLALFGQEEQYSSLTLADLRAMNPVELGHLRAHFESDFIAFVRWVFLLIRGDEYLWAEPQRCIYEALHGVETGLSTRLIINAPPRFGKTELVEIFWPAWHIVKNPRCCFFVICASDDLVRLNSKTVRDVLGLPEVLYLWPGSRLSSHSKDAGIWMTAAGGYFRAAPVGGQITGFGAGKLGAQYFSGALILGDTLKAQDMRSFLMMGRLNQLFHTTIKNRVNSRWVPIIVEAQRLHDGELSGYLLGGGSGEMWHHARIPAMVIPEEEANARNRYESDWSHGIPLNFELKDGFVWPLKFEEKEYQSEMSNPDVFAAQYLQNPRITQGSFFRVSWFKRYEKCEIFNGLIGTVTREEKTIQIKYMSVFADTAMKTGEHNDFSVFQLWGYGEDDNIYLLDQLRGKWEDPELLAASTRWLRMYEPKVPRRYGWRDITIEDKASGTGLIAWLRREWGTRVIPIQREVDKVSRAHGVSLPMSQGRVWIPQQAPWIPNYVAEFSAFNVEMTHAHDDQVDPTMDAINKMLNKGGRSIIDVL